MRSGSFFRTAVPRSAAVAAQEATHEGVLRRRLEPSRRVAARDRGEAPTQRWQREPDGPGRKPGRRAGPLGLQGFEIEREGLRGRRERREAVAAAERREVGPVMGVRPLGRRRVVLRREIVLDGPRELGEGRPAPLEWLNRGQRVAARAVSGRRADLGAVNGRFRPVFFRRKLWRFPCLRRESSQTRTRC